jgi:catechol 2,3-dioxygenase-like lactoylglutathione lyase family enzyme
MRGAEYPRPRLVPPGVAALDHCVIAVSDWDRSNAFYAAVLDAEVVARGEGYVYRFGSNQLNIHGPGVDGEPNAEPPVVPGGADLCFVWDGPIDEAVAHLERLGVPIELGPVARFGARGNGTSVYFRDPDRSLLELISYS